MALCRTCCCLERTHPLLGLLLSLGQASAVFGWVSASSLIIHALLLSPCHDQVLRRHRCAAVCRPDPYSVHADCAAHCCTPTCWLFVLLLCMYAALLLHHPTYDSMRHAGMKLLVLSYLVWLCVLNVSAPSVLRILSSVVVNPFLVFSHVK